MVCQGGNIDQDKLWMSQQQARIMRSDLISFVDLTFKLTHSLGRLVGLWRPAVIVSVSPECRGFDSPLRDTSQDKRKRLVTTFLHFFL